MLERRTIHLVNPMWDAAGGSEWHTIELFQELQPHAEVRLWSGHEPAAAFAALATQGTAAQGIVIQKITAEHFPRGGTLVVVGAYQPLGEWISQARPRRAIVLYNVRAPRELIGCMRQLLTKTAEQVEVVFASESLRQQTKYVRGIVELSKIDLKRFAPRPRGKREPFVIGRLSRDDPRKHHAEDVELYRRAIDRGCRVRLMGATCLASACRDLSGIELLPTLAEPAEQFLQSLDCLVYRTKPVIYEAFGRVIHEAMASGLPVVCHRDGGYSASIIHGQSGFLFETTDEALEIIERLRREPELAAAVGAAARAKVEQLYSPEERAKVVEYFLR